MDSGHLQELYAARQAAQRLAAYADSACRKGTLRDDTHSIVDEALQLLQELEEKVCGATAADMFFWLVYSYQAVLCHGGVSLLMWCQQQQQQHVASARVAASRNMLKRHCSCCRGEM
jgi:hypothetical protein